MPIAMDLVLAPPTAVVPRRGRMLVDVLSDFPAPEQLGGDAVNNFVAQRWRMGITFQPRPAQQWTILDEDPCATHTKGAAATFENAVIGEPFTAYKAIECSTLSTTFDEFREFLRIDAELGTSNLLARRLMDTALTLNVPDAATVALAGSMPAMRAIGSIDHELNIALNGGRGIILIDPQSAAEGYAAMTPDLDGTLYSPSGHDIVIHSEFLVEATADGGAGYGANDGTVWGTGPIYGTVTSATFFDEADQFLDLTRNEGIVRAEIFGLVAFDPTTVFSQRVVLPTT